MSKLLEAAKAVVEMYADPPLGGLDSNFYDAMKALRQALLAEPEPVYFKLSDDDHAEIPFIPPCPFCGGSAGISYGRKTVDGVPNQPWRYFECDDCSATAEPEAWYERTTPPSIEALIADIDGLNRYPNKRGQLVVYVDDLVEVTDKYRSAK